MYITPIKSFPHDRLGYLKAGDVVEVSDSEGARLIRMGLVNPAAARPGVSAPVPGVAGGETTALSASPAAQALPQTTQKESGNGDLPPRKRGRPKKQAAG